MPEPQVQKPVAAKPWDEMSESEQTEERARLLKLEKEAAAPDPIFETKADQQIKSMKRIFANQKWFTVQLFQINGAMKAEGITSVPDRECGVNGYNFIVPRGRPVSLPEGLVRVLYNAGEIDGFAMINLGLMTVGQVARDQQLSQADAERLALLGKVQ